MSENLPLEGLLVVSMEQAVAAPYCSSRLADAGARVIKIERPEGDFARAYDRFAGGESSYFVWLNRGKESLTCNIKDPDDAALLHRMIDKADVFIQNLAPGAAARSGFGSSELRARNERLITVDISGYGADGDYADMRAYDLLVQAESGLCSVTGAAEAPGRVGVSICDVSCGMYCHAAVLEALIARGRTGRGTAIDNSLFAGFHTVNEAGEGVVACRAAHQADVRSLLEDLFSFVLGNATEHSENFPLSFEFLEVR